MQWLEAEIEIDGETPQAVANALGDLASYIFKEIEAYREMWLIPTADSLDTFAAKIHLKNWDGKCKWGQYSYDFSIKNIDPLGFSFKNEFSDVRLDYPFDGFRQGETPDETNICSMFSVYDNHNNPRYPIVSVTDSHELVEAIAPNDNAWFIFSFLHGTNSNYILSDGDHWVGLTYKLATIPNTANIHRLGLNDFVVSHDNNPSHLSYDIRHIIRKLISKHVDLCDV